MPLDHDWAAGGQCRSGVATGGGEREREVAGAEHGHRTEGHHALTQVRPRERLALRLGRVDTDSEVVTAANHVGEQAQLTGCATQLAGHPALRKPTLRRRGLDDRLAVGLDLRGDGLQEGGSLLGVVSR